MDDRAGFLRDDLPALVGSRLCHDLINPLGAIGNGVELLALMPGSTSPEVSLIEDAVRDAQARIRFFRIAFGHATADSRISRREIGEILKGLYPQNGRLVVDWEPEPDLPRTDAKIGLLMLACAEHVLPLGGEVKITATGGSFRLQGTGARVSVDPDLWAILNGAVSGRPIAPAEVQYILFAQEAQRQDRVIHAKADEGSLTITA